MACRLSAVTSPGAWAGGKSSRPPSLPIVDPQKPSESQSTLGRFDRPVVTGEIAFLSVKPGVIGAKHTRRPLIARGCLNSAQLAGPCSLADLVSIPVECGTRGPFFMEPRAACPELAVGCVPDWGTPLLLVMSCKHSSRCTSVSKNTEC